MPIPNEHAVRTALLPYNERIRHVIESGFQAYVRKTATGSNLYRRTDAAEVSDLVTQAAIVEFDAKQDSRVFQGRATSRVLLGQRVLARFKKADRHRKGSNIRTGADEAYLNPRLSFPDAPEAMKIEICWTLNATGTSFDEIIVNGRDGKRILFSYNLPGGVQEVLPFPQNTVPTEREIRRSVVKLKTPKGKGATGNQAS